MSRSSLRKVCERYIGSWYKPFREVSTVEISNTGCVDFSSMASKPIDIRWITTGSQPYWIIMYSIVLLTIFHEYFNKNHEIIPVIPEITTTHPNPFYWTNWPINEVHVSPVYIYHCRVVTLPQKSTKNWVNHLIKFSIQTQNYSIMYILPHCKNDYVQWQ